MMFYDLLLHYYDKYKFINIFKISLSPYTFV